jgi:hypothetical protein
MHRQTHAVVRHVDSGDGKDGNADAVLDRSEHVACELGLSVHCGSHHSTDRRDRGENDLQMGSGQVFRKRPFCKGQIDCGRRSKRGDANLTAAQDVLDVEGSQRETVCLLMTDGMI